MYKVTFYNIKEEIIFEKLYDISSINKLYKYIQNEFECNNEIPFKRENHKLYVYINTFNCYGRFEITE